MNQHLGSLSISWFKAFRGARLHARKFRLQQGKVHLQLSSAIHALSARIGRRLQLLEALLECLFIGNGLRLVLFQGIAHVDVGEVVLAAAHAGGVLGAEVQVRGSEAAVGRVERFLLGL